MIPLISSEPIKDISTFAVTSASLICVQVSTCKACPSEHPVSHEATPLAFCVSSGYCLSDEWYKLICNINIKLGFGIPGDS